MVEGGGRREEVSFDGLDWTSLSMSHNDTRTMVTTCIASQNIAAFPRPKQVS